MNVPRRSRFLAAVVLALSFGGVLHGFRPLGAAGEEGVLGTWRGVVTDMGQTYSLEMVVERVQPGGYAGTTRYSGSVNCGGPLTFRRQRAGLYEFDETISTGPECMNGRIEVYRTGDGRLEWEWHEPGRGGDPRARATLSPAR